MAKNKTAETEVPVAEFLSKIPNEQRRKDCQELNRLIEKHIGITSKMWGPSIIGFGSYAYTYESGHSGTAPKVGFASRSNGIVLYLSSGIPDHAELLKLLGKHKTTKGCIYIAKLADVDQQILLEMVKRSMEMH